MKKGRVYIAGHIDLKNIEETRKRFEAVEKVLREKGYDVYNPAKKELGPHSREELAKEDFNALDRADILFVITNKASVGTLIEIGYFTALKRRDPGKKIVVVYTGNEKYKFTTMYDFLKNHSPMTYYCDLITNDLREAIDFL